MTFNKNDVVNFERNSSFKKNNTPIIALIKVNYPDEQEKTAYIIEHDEGFVPDDKRIALHGLDANKKYLFVMESELTPV